MPDTSQLIVWLIIGAAAGYIASFIVRFGRRQGPLADIVIGLVGALIGGLIFKALNINILSNMVFTGRDFLSALVGAIVLLVGLRLLRR